MEIKVVGGGCPNCKKLLERTREAVRELGIEADVLYITDMEEIMKTGILHTPGLMIDGAVKMTGRVPSVSEIKGMIGEAQR